MNQDPYAAFSDPVAAPVARAPAPAVRRTAAPALPRYEGPLPTDPRAVFPSLVEQESGGRAGVLGPQTRYGRAEGRTQMLPATAQEMARKIGVPWRPELMRGQSPEAAAYQDRLGLAYLEQGLAETGNMRDALRYYHGGPNRALWGPKTQAYSEEVLGRIGEGQSLPQVPQEGDPYAAFSEPAPATPSNMIEYEDSGPLDLKALIRGDGPEEVDIDLGLLRENGRLYTLNQDDERVDLGSEAEWAALTPGQQDELFQAAMNGRSAEYRAEYEASLAGAENVPAWLANLSQGNSLGLVGEAVAGLNYLSPFTDGISRSKAHEAGRDAWRDRQEQLLRDDPLGTVGMQLLGGLATPGLNASGGWIGGATGTQRVARASAVGAGYGGVAGVTGAEDADLGSRLQSGLLGAGVGAGTGGLLDAGAQRATAGAARQLSSPSPQRLLSREGVQLTPGQMLEPTPLVGPMLRGLEDGASSIPFLGSTIQGARNEGVESFNIAALNRALAHIGQKLPKGVRPGYAGVEEVQSRLSRAYDDVLPEITAQLDQPLYDDIARVLDDAASEMPEDRLKQLTAVLKNRVFRNIDDSGATISGEQFKRIESELGALSRQYRTANDPSVVAFGEAVTGLQNAVREMIARQNPQQAARLRQINEGYANLVRVERAAGSSPAQATEGVFSPTQLGVATRQGSSRSAAGRGDGLLQDLAIAGRQVLPSRVGDSGTATRGAVTGLLGGGALGMVDPMLAVPVIAGAVTYSKPAQKLLNLIYRATDRRSATSALAELQRFAGRNPALQPYYQAAVEAVQHAFPSQPQEPAPVATGLLAPTRP